MPGQLLDAGGIGPAAAPHPDLAAPLEDVTAVEGAGRLDVRDAVALAAHGNLDRRGLGPARQCPGSADDREIAVHDHGVLDEDRVGTVVGRLDLGQRPAGRDEGGDIRMPLPVGAVEVDGLALDMRDQPVVKARTRSADEGAA